MDRSTWIENVAATAAGVGAALVYTMLFVFMSLPVAETLQRLVS
jgi:hypothetical protein